MQRQQGLVRQVLVLEPLVLVRQVLEPLVLALVLVLVLVLVLKRLMVLRALVQLRAVQALALAKQKLLGEVFDLVLVLA